MVGAGPELSSPASETFCRFDAIAPPRVLDQIRRLERLLRNPRLIESERQRIQIALETAGAGNGR
jgi:hypothetical protein